MHTCKQWRLSVKRHMERKGKPPRKPQPVPGNDECGYFWTWAQQHGSKSSFESNNYHTTWITFDKLFLNMFSALHVFFSNAESKGKDICFQIHWVWQQVVRNRNTQAKNRYQKNLLWHSNKVFVLCYFSTLARSEQNSRAAGPLGIFQRHAPTMEKASSVVKAAWIHLKNLKCKTVALKQKLSWAITKNSSRCSFFSVSAWSYL